MNSDIHKMNCDERKGRMWAASVPERRGTGDWDEVRESVIAEAGNFDAVIAIASGVATPPDRLVAAVRGLAEFHSYTGLASVISLGNAVASLRKSGNVLGEAHCVSSLGDIAHRRSDHNSACARFEAALPLYRKVGSASGQANCISRLAKVALARSGHETARAQFEAALPFYRKVGDVVGEANCIQGLGLIALELSGHKAARARYEAALLLYRKVGDVLGEANCIRSLGDIADEKGDIATALRLWQEALVLYGRIPEPYSIGLTHVRLAQRAATPAEAERHREATRRAWVSIDRADLIAKYLDGTPKAPPQID
jgi:tetratricopeptide (TPR) repeat protein